MNNNDERDYAEEHYNRHLLDDETDPDDEITPATQDPDAMPASVHGEAVVSAFRHLPLYGRTDTYTVITQDTNSSTGVPRYSVFRTRFAPILGRWSIDTDYAVASGLAWTHASRDFTSRIASRVS